MAKRRCYYCETKGRFGNKLEEYKILDMNSIFACENCEQGSNYRAVFLKDKNDVNTRNIGGNHEGEYRG